MWPLCVVPMFGFLFQISRVLQDRNFDLFLGLFCVWWQSFAEGLLDGTCPHGICRTSYIMDQHAHAAAAMGRVEARYAEASGADRQQMAEPERLSSKQVLQPNKPKHTIVIMRPS